MWFIMSVSLMNCSVNEGVITQANIKLMTTQPTGHGEEAFNNGNSKLLKQFCVSTDLPVECQLISHIFYILLA